MSSAHYIVEGSNDDPGWAERRLTGVGASETAMMLGEDPRHGGGGPAVLWAWKTRREVPEDLGALETVQWGHRMEPVIIDAYSEGRYSGRPAWPARVQLRSVDHPWAMATIDGWTQHPDHGDVPLEVKNVGAYQADRWVGGTPPEMWWQLQHQMLVTGAPLASIAACVGGNALWWEDVPRDDVAVRRLTREGAAFWRCVSSDTIPPHVPTLASARSLYPAGRDETGEIALGGSRWLDLDDEREHLRREERRINARLEAIEAKIREAIGPHAAGRLDTGAIYTCTTTTRGAYTVNGVSYRTLRRKAPGGE